MRMQYRRALEEMNRIGIRKIVIAVDMDFQTNDNVSAARRTLIRLGSDAGFDMIPLRWDKAFKGIDDFLLELNIQEKEKIL